MITLEDLIERVNYWQQRLSLLGISHWRSYIAIVDQPQGTPNASAAVKSSGDYDTCWMEFKESSLETLTEQELDEAIVHELLHVFLRDFDDAILSAWDQHSAAFNDAWEARVEHEREGVIDRMARLIVHLHG